MASIAIIKAVSDLRQLYNEFTPETEVWKRNGHLRSPYRALIVMGLAIGVSDKQGFKVWIQLLELCPTASDLKKAWNGNRHKIIKIVEPLGRKTLRIALLNTAVMFGDNIPDKTADLQAHPGIGAAIAEKVVGYGFGKPALPVDANVKRVLERISGSDFEDDKAVRGYLKGSFQQNEWIDIHELLRLHGQVLCGRVPECKSCPITTCSMRKLSYIGSMTKAREDAKLVIDEWKNWRRLLLNPAN